MVSSVSLDFHGMVGRSPAMRALFEQIERVAPFDVPVLILGESGTGKELVARAIQDLSARNVRRFETVNCATLTRELLLSELFGHERGAFTGAVAHKAGLLALANGGTAFLDEVGELPLDAQAMLLRFLHDGEVRPLGSTRTTRIDVRVIAATHRDLEAAIAEGTFREDLYYRVSDVVLEVPPLRERRGDIVLLVEHFRIKFNDQYGLSVEPPEPEALRTLEGAAWPGNVRELEKVLKQAMIFRGSGTDPFGGPPNTGPPAHRVVRLAVRSLAVAPGPRPQPASRCSSPDRRRARGRHAPGARPRVRNVWRGGAAGAPGAGETRISPTGTGGPGARHCVRASLMEAAPVLLPSHPEIPRKTVKSHGAQKRVQAPIAPTSYRGIRGFADRPRDDS